MKVVINKTTSPFSLSGPAMTHYLTLGGNIEIERHSTQLIETLETMGATACGLGCELVILEISGEQYGIVVDENGYEQLVVADTPVAKPVKQKETVNETPASTPDNSDM